jgi:hypothetical protein
MGMGKAFITCGGTTVLLAIGYATVVATNPQYSHWSITLLLVLLILTGLGTIASGIIWLIQWYKKKRMGSGEVGYNPLNDKLRETLISARAREKALLEIKSSTDKATALRMCRHAYNRNEVAVTRLKKERTKHPEYNYPINVLQSAQANLNTFIQSGMSFNTFKSKINNDARNIIKTVDDILNSQINQNNTQQPRLDTRDSMDDKPRDFEIIWLGESFFLKGARNDLHSYISADEKDKIALILRAKIRISTFKQINVQSIALKIGGQEFPWDEEDVNVFGEPVTDEYQFEFPLSITRGKQIVRIKALVDGKEHILPNHLIVDFPRKSN